MGAGRRGGDEQVLTCAPRYVPGGLAVDVRPLVGRRVAEGRRDAGFVRTWRDPLIASAWFYASWALLVFVPMPPIVVAALVVSIGLAMTALLTNAWHPILHGSVGTSPARARAVLRVLAPLGACARWWVVKHNASHHGFPNVVGHDPDMEQGRLFRYDVAHAWHPWHRWQHLYAWMLYPFIILRYVLVSDPVFIVTGRHRGVRVEPPSPGRSVVLLLDKLTGPALILVPAFLLHGALSVVAVVIAAYLVNGLSTALIFVPNHFGDDTPGTLVGDDGSIGIDFGTAVVRAIANVRVHNRALRWYMSALDYHIEHHLFAWVPHRDLHLMAPLVEEATSGRGEPYRVHPSLWQGLKGHYRRLRALGHEPSAVTTPQVTIAT